MLIHPERVACLVDELSEAKNKCTAHIIERTKMRINLLSAIRLLVRHVLLHSHYFENQQNLITLLHSAIECRDFFAWKRALNTIKDDADDDNSLATSSHLSESRPHYEYSSNVQRAVKTKVQKTNLLLLSLILLSERSIEDGICMPLYEQFTSSCQFTYFPSAFAARLEDHLYTPKRPLPYPPDINQLIIVAAKADTQTLYDDSFEEYSKMQVKNKSFYGFNYASHVSLNLDTCGEEIFEQLLAQGSLAMEVARKKTEACVEMRNEFGIKWFERLQSEFQALWRVKPKPGMLPAELKPFTPKPRPPPRRYGVFRRLKFSWHIALYIAAPVLVFLVLIWVSRRIDHRWRQTHGGAASTA